MSDPGSGALRLKHRQLLCLLPTHEAESEKTTHRKENTNVNRQPVISHVSVWGDWGWRSHAFHSHLTVRGCMWTRQTETDRQLAYRLLASSNVDVFSFPEAAKLNHSNSRSFTLPRIAKNGGLKCRLSAAAVKLFWISWLDILNATKETARTFYGCNVHWSNGSTGATVSE